MARPVGGRVITAAAARNLGATNEEHRAQEQKRNETKDSHGPNGKAHAATLVNFSLSRAAAFRTAGIHSRRRDKGARHRPACTANACKAKARGAVSRAGSARRHPSKPARSPAGTRPARSPAEDAR